MKREMQQWSKSSYTELPKRGRLRLPAIRLVYSVDRMMRLGMEHLERVMAPVMAFGGRSAPSGSEDK